jgi:putative effector of murein hydrolase
MTTLGATPLAISIAARMAAVDELALLAAMVVAASVIGAVVALVLLDVTVPTSYRLATAQRPSVLPLAASQDVSQAA